MVEEEAGNNFWLKFGVQAQGDFVLMESDKGGFAILACSSPTLLAEVIATRKARESKQEARGSTGEFINAVRTRLRSN